MRNRQTMYHELAMVQQRWAELLAMQAQRTPQMVDLLMDSTRSSEAMEITVLQGQYVELTNAIMADEQAERDEQALDHCAWATACAEHEFDYIDVL